MWDQIWVLILILVILSMLIYCIFAELRVRRQKRRAKYLNSELIKKEDFIADMFFQAAQEQITGRIEGHKPGARKICRTCPLPALVYRLMDDRDYDECEAERRGRCL